MPLCLYRRVSLIPGLRLNASRGGLSLSIGHRGLWYSVGHRGQRVTIGLPHTGIWWIETIPPARAPHAGHRLAFVLVVIAALSAVYWVVAAAGGGAEGWALRGSFAP
jgi:Protein of unknown function (DUF4236)